MITVKYSCKGIISISSAPQLLPITREELVRTLDRSHRGEDLERREPEPNVLAQYFRERRRQTACVRELLAGRKERDA